MIPQNMLIPQAVHRATSFQQIPEARKGTEKESITKLKEITRQPD